MLHMPTFPGSDFLVVSAGTLVSWLRVYLRGLRGQAILHACCLSGTLRSCLQWRFALRFASILVMPESARLKLPVAVGSITAKYKVQ